MAELRVGDVFAGAGVAGVRVRARPREAAGGAALAGVPRGGVVAVHEEEEAGGVRAGGGVDPGLDLDLGVVSALATARGVLGRARAKERGAREGVQGHDRARRDREFVLDERERAGGGRARDRARGVRRGVGAEHVRGGGAGNERELVHEGVRRERGVELEREPRGRRGEVRGSGGGGGRGGRGGGDGARRRRAREGTGAVRHRAPPRVLRRGDDARASL